MRKLSRCFFYLMLLYSGNTSAQNKNIRIIILPNDSIYKWNALSADSLTIREFSVEKATVLDFNNTKHFVAGVQSICERGNCDSGIAITYYSNGLMESKGQYGYTTNINSLKQTSSDGFLNYIGKTGWWYYWNEQGFLIRKEKWLKDKLVQTLSFVTLIRNRPPKTTAKH